MSVTGSAALSEQASRPAGQQASRPAGRQDGGPAGQRDAGAVFGLKDVTRRRSERKVASRKFMNVGQLMLRRVSTAQLSPGERFRKSVAAEAMKWI